MTLTTFPSQSSPKMSSYPSGWQTIFQPIIFLTDETLQASCYFHGKCSNKLHSFVSPVLTITAKTHHATHIVANHPRSLHILLMRCKFHLSSSFPQTAALWNRLSKGCFPDHYNLTCLWSTIISPAYPRKLCLLLCESLPQVALGSWTWWTLL